MRTKVIIDPLVDIQYASFYIKGLTDKFGRKNRFFRAEPFRKLKNRTKSLNFIILQHDIETRYSINMDDSYLIQEDLYEWCDVYAAVNANLKKTPEQFHSKLISLAPSFGIRIWNLPETIFYAIHNWMVSDIKKDAKKFFGKYKRQWQLRRPYEEYQPNDELNNQSIPSVFHLSTLWLNDEWNKNDEGVNKARANFIRACKSIDTIHFEGGLSVTNQSTVNPDFIPLVFNGIVLIQEYLKKTKESVIVFNTPAFWSCHGWKLGEYLALGKAIISTSLSNDLPEPLVHGVHIHFVENDEEEIRRAVLLIVNDNAYRQTLENGAREYWEKYGTPVKSLELMGIKSIL